MAYAQSAPGVRTNNAETPQNAITNSARNKSLFHSPHIDGQDAYVWKLVQSNGKNLRT
jgi:hypothetical protein